MSATNEPGEWRDVRGEEIRVGDRVRARNGSDPIGEILAVDKTLVKISGNGWWPLALRSWQRWTTTAPPVPDCGGHVGETFVGHVRPGQYVTGDGMLMVAGGYRIDREWTSDDERANSTHAVCATCAELAREPVATIPASVHNLNNYGFCWNLALGVRGAWQCHECKAVIRSDEDVISPPSRHIVTCRWYHHVEPAPIDPLSALRIEAARMLAAGHDERDVLGALDAAEIKRRKLGWKVPIVCPDDLADCVEDHREARIVRAAGDRIAAETIAHVARQALGCYHNRRAIPGNCPWCAVVATRSDAR